MPRKFWIGKDTKFTDRMLDGEDDGKVIKITSNVPASSTLRALTGEIVSDENGGTTHSTSVVFGSYEVSPRRKTIIELVDAALQKQYRIIITTHPRRPELDRIIVRYLGPKPVSTIPDDPDVESFSRTGQPTTTPVTGTGPKTGTFTGPVQPGTIIAKNGTAPYAYDDDTKMRTIDGNAEIGSINYVTGAITFTTDLNPTSADAHLAT